jgi:hypothetical protein
MNIEDIAHTMAGLLASLATFVNPVVGVVAVALFIIYELDEEWHLEDESYRDIAEFATGYYAGILLKLTGVI